MSCASPPVTPTQTISESKDHVPHGPDEVRAALIAACDRLCGERMPSSVTVRQVAAEAHVATGLVHHYFESKEALLVATVRSASAEIGAEAQAVLESTGDPGAAIASWWRFLERRPAFRRIIVWWVADGGDVNEMIGTPTWSGTLARILAPRHPQSASVRAGLVGTLVMAGMLAPGANRSAGLDAADDSIARELERLSIEVVRGAPLSSTRD